MSGDDARMRARNAGKDAVKARTVWTIEIKGQHFRCLLNERGTPYVMETRDSVNGWIEMLRGTDPADLLARLACSKTVKAILTTPL